MSPKRILLVEDELIIAQDEKQLLESLGYVVTGIASSGEAALRSVEEDTPDLVLMDIVLKGDMDGIEVAEKIREQYDVPAVFVTAYADKQFIERAKLTEPFGYVVKPTDQQSLASIIEVALYKHSIDQRLRESEEKFATVFRVAPNLMAITRFKDGHIVDVNDIFAHTLGYSRDELLGQNTVELGLWESPEERTKFVGDIKEHGEAHGYEVAVRTKVGDRRWMLLAGENIDLRGERHIVTVASDITERKRMEDELEYLAAHDSLTGLYNRNVLEQRLKNETHRATRYNHVLSVFLLDIDHFKLVNDTYGHGIGDTVLRGFAKVLEGSIRETDYASRYGGEEFVVILPETSFPKAEELAERLLSRVADHPFPIEDDKELKLTASIGIATFPQHAQSWDDLLNVADSAMYAAKKAGRNQVKTP